MFRSDKFRNAIDIVLYSLIQNKMTMSYRQSTNIEYIAKHLIKIMSERKKNKYLMNATKPIHCSMFAIHSYKHVRKTGIFLNRIEENIRQLVARRKNIEICVIFFLFISRASVCMFA